VDDTTDASLLRPEEEEKTEMIKIEIQGLKKSRERLQQRAERLRGQSGNLYPDLGKLLSKSIKTTVESGGREPRWPKRKGTYSHPILDLTGTMRDAAELSALKEWVVQNTRHTLNIRGPNYGLVHQYSSKKLPERKYVKPVLTERTAMGDRIRKEWNIKR
jgi:phage gpG-like protein